MFYLDKNKCCTLPPPNEPRFAFRLDYCGIALLTMGSFVPWLYYSFYCRMSPKIVYLVLIFVLGTACIVVSMWDKFAEPKYRPLRAGIHDLPRFG